MVSVLSVASDEGLTQNEVVVDLSHKSIVSFVGLDSFRFLKHVDVSHNCIEIIEHLPASIEVLCASHNQISKIVGLQQLDHLTVLDLSYNQLTVLNGLDSNVVLRDVYVANNFISTIMVESLQGLESLDLENNRISSLEEIRALSVLKSLNSLILRGNKIAREKYEVFIGNLIPTLSLLDKKEMRAPRASAHSPLPLVHTINASPPRTKAEMDSILLRLSKPKMVVPFSPIKKMAPTEGMTKEERRISRTRLLSPKNVPVPVRANVGKKGVEANTLRGNKQGMHSLHAKEDGGRVEEVYSPKQVRWAPERVEKEHPSDSSAKRVYSSFDGSSGVHEQAQLSKLRDLQLAFEYFLDFCNMGLDFSQLQDFKDMLEQNNIIHFNGAPQEYFAATSTEPLSRASSLITSVSLAFLFFISLVEDDILNHQQSQRTQGFKEYMLSSGLLEREM